MIFRIDFVQISEIYTHPPFLIPFWHQYHIGKPLQELNPLDMTNFQQLLHFFLDDLILLSPEMSALLYNRLGLILSLCTATYGSMPTMYSGLHANKSALFRNTSTIISWILSSNCLPILTLWPFLSGSSSMLISSPSSNLGV